MSAIPMAARKTVWERQNNQCARCGGRGYQIHHRMRRREGGHAVSNLVGLCRSDHEWAHKFPNAAKDDGYIIATHVDDPATVPIRTFMGPVLFDDKGGITVVQIT